MKKFVFGVLFCSIASTYAFGQTAKPALGALSPLDQSLKEIQAIVESQELRQNLKTSESIKDIWRVGNRYIISTENRQLVVDVVYSQRQGPGPKEFKLNFSPAKPFGE